MTQRRRTGQEHRQRDGGRQHWQPLGPGGTKGQQDHVAGHVGGEDPTHPEVAGGIDQARDQGEQRQRQQQRLDPWRGVRMVRAGLHRRTLPADRWRPGVRPILAKVAMTRASAKHRPKIWTGLFRVWAMPA
jgi:hypothetical protein